MQNQLSLRRYGIFVCFFSVLCLYACTGWAQKIKSPEDVLGYRAGADYKLARYETIVEYFRHVDENSDRVNIRELGATTEGKQLIIAEISSPETIGDIRRHMENSRKIADPRFIGNNEEERRLIDESKVVVFIRCNVHSTEIASSQMAMELLYDLAAGTSPEIKEILARTIVVLMPSANPDGLDIVVDWYERSLGKPWEGSGMPWLYQKYAGHDNNWDWYMLNLKENRLITRLCYKEWFPNIVWDIHQMGNDGVRLMLPPFIDPQNPDLHPLNTYITLITAGCMASELTRAGKTGLGHGILYNNWSHGGFRLMTNLQNMVGVLSEAASVTIASPIFQRKMESLSVNTPNPWPGGWWRLRDIVEYEKIAGMGLLTFAARNHELYTSYTLTLARDAIEKGKKEPPFAWLVPPDQHDPRTAAEMLEKFNATGVEVHQAESAFTADGVPYPSGTYILYCSQPYRSHLCSLMERQNPYIIPNRVAAWTLPLQMGVRSVAVNQPFEAKARKLPSIPMPEGGTRGPGDADGYLVRAASNDDYRLINRFYKAGISFYVISSGDKWRKETGVDTPTGSFFISDGKKVRSALPGLLKGISTTLIGVRGSSAEQRSILLNAAAPRIGLYQPWTASMDEGWTRFILDEFEYAYTSVHNAEILTGNLRQRYDCLILPSDGTR